MTAAELLDRSNTSMGKVLAMVEMIADRVDGNDATAMEGLGVLDGLLRVIDREIMQACEQVKSAQAGREAKVARHRHSRRASK